MLFTRGVKAARGMLGSTSGRSIPIRSINLVKVVKEDNFKPRRKMDVPVTSDQADVATVLVIRQASTCGQPCPKRSCASCERIRHGTKNELVG